MADNDNTEKKSGEMQSVDDILAEILNKDGGFSDSFNDRFSAYLGESASQFTAALHPDLSDRQGEAEAGQRVLYEEPETSSARRVTADERIKKLTDEKLPENIRNIYAETEIKAQRPEFTAGGSVLYPTMGSGVSGERVVFDADWEERAKKEAEHAQKVREDRMLRGDSPYVRSITGRSFNPNVSGSGSAYIDPLSEEKDIASPEYSKGSKDEGLSSFFLSGPPADQRKNESAGAGAYAVKKERQNTSAGGSVGAGEKPDWLQVVDKGAKKKKKNKKSGKATVYAELPRKKDSTAESDAGRPEKNEKKREPSPDTPQSTPERVRYSPEHGEKLIKRNEEETANLKNTVAGIVEKYNKRSEEEAEMRRRALEEQQRKEAEAKAAEAERRKNFSEEFLDIIDSADNSDDYEDITRFDGNSAPRENFVFSDSDTVKDGEKAPTDGFGRFFDIPADVTSGKNVPDKEKIVDSDRAGGKNKKGRKKK